MRKNILTSKTLELKVFNIDPPTLVLLRNNEKNGRKYSVRGAYNLLQNLEDLRNQYHFDISLDPLAKSLIDKYKHQKEFISTNY